MGFFKFFKDSLFVFLFLFITSFLLPLANAESGNLSNASLNGTYIVADFGVDNSEPDGWSGLIEVTFDGNGNATYRSLSSDNTGAFPYNVTSEGLFTAPGPTQSDNIGVVNSDGRIFTFIYKKESDPDVSIKVGIKIDKKNKGMPWMMLLLAD